MNQQYKSLSIIFLLGLLTFGSLFYKFYPGDFFSSDQAYKVKQIRDLVDKKNYDFSCVYPGKEMDTDYSFFPAKYPMVHYSQDKCYYVFPFQFTLINLPFYFLFGIKGIFIGSVIIGLFVLLVWAKLLFNLELKITKMILYSICFVLGLGFLFYIYIPSDHIYVSLFCLFGFGNLLYGKRHWEFVVAGILLGLAVAIRFETILFSISTFIIFYLFIYQKPKKKLERYAIFSFCIVLVLFFVSNLFYLDHILGLRGHEFDEKKNELLIDRLQRIWLFIWGRETEGTLLKDTPFFLLILIAPFFVKYFDRIYKYKYISLFLLIVSYIFAIPFLIKVEPYLQYGERYLLVIYPLVLLLIIFIIERSSINKIIKTAIVLFLISSSIYSGNKSYALAKKISDFSKYSLAKQIEMEENMKNSEAIILRSLSLNGVFLNYSDLNKRIFLAVSDEKYLNLIEILRKNKIEKISVVHIKFRNSNIDFVKEKSTDLSKSFVPVQFRFKEESSDLGNEWVELRNYKI